MAHDGFIITLVTEPHGMYIKKKKRKRQIPGARLIPDESGFLGKWLIIHKENPGDSYYQGILDTNFMP